MNKEQAIKQFKSIEPFDHVDYVNPVTGKKSPLYTETQILILLDCIFGVTKPSTNSKDKD